MKISLRRAGPVVVVSASGRLTLPDVSLADTVEELLHRGDRLFVIDLKDVVGFEATRMGDLAAVFTKVTVASGSLRFVFGQTEWLRHVRSKGLDTVFPNAESEQEALESLIGP